MKNIGWLVAGLVAIIATYLYATRGNGGGGVKVKPDPGFTPPTVPNTGTGFSLENIFGGFKSIPIFQTRNDVDRVPALIRASSDAFSGVLGAIQSLTKSSPKSATPPDRYFYSGTDYGYDVGQSPGAFEYTTD